MSSVLITDRRVYAINNLYSKIPANQAELDGIISTLIDGGMAASFYLYGKGQDNDDFRDVLIAPYNKFESIGQSGPINIEKFIPRFPQVNGVTVIMGGSGSGKSTLVQAIQSERDYKYIKFGEPDADSFIGSPIHLLYLMDVAMKSDEIYIIDSFKSILIKSSSNLSKGGTSKDILEILSDINSQLVRADKSLIVTVNPQNPEIEKTWFTLLKGVCSSVVWLERPMAGVFSSRYSLLRSDVEFVINIGKEEEEKKRNRKKLGASVTLPSHELKIDAFMRRN